MAKALGITVHDLLGEPKTRPRGRPRRQARPGPLQQVGKLPRRQQQKVIEMAEGFLALHKNTSGKPALIFSWIPSERAGGRAQCDGLP